MSKETGSIRISAMNIFPIIKKSLYPHREIFMRELTSNAVDALNRLSFLERTRKFRNDQQGEYRIDVSIDKIAKTLSVEDNGDGMTKEEVNSNINEIAFSGAKEFLEKYVPDVKMIGCFGLGFYSVFMVAKRAIVETKSYKAQENACQWSCQGDMEYQLEDSNRSQRGTKITLHLEVEQEEFLDTERIERIIQKYSDFVPFPIYLNDRCVNTINAPWHQSKSDLTSKDYRVFYKKLYPDTNDPMFWIHLEIEGAISLRGLIFVPSLPQEKGNLRFFCNRVFVQDNCTELVPEFLSFLDGVIDSEDLPLNVSRDKFQGHPNTLRIKNFIQRKMAEQIVLIAKTRRADYMRFWEFYHQNIKMGALVDEKWFKEVSPYFLFPSSKKSLTTLSEYQERAAQKHPKEIYYLTDIVQQSPHLETFKNRDTEVLFLSDRIDHLLLTTKYLEKGINGAEWKRIDTVFHRHPDEPKERPADWNAFKEYFSQYVKDGTTIEIDFLHTPEVSGLFRVSDSDAKSDDYKKISILYDKHAPYWKDWKENRIFVVNMNNRLIRLLYDIFINDHNNPLLAKVCPQIYQHALLRCGRIKQEKIGDVLFNAEQIISLACESELNES